MNGLDYFSAIQQAISGLLTTFEPEFLRFGTALFLSMATVLIVWHGITFMFATGSLQDRVFEFVKTLLFISMGYAMIAFYESPIPGIGTSFSNLITDQTAYFANVLDASAVGHVYEHLDNMFNSFIAPGALEVTAGLIYLALLVVLTLAKASSVAIVAFGLIASAVCGLLGPLFVPFFIVPKLDFLFWGWFKAFLQYSFMPVVAYAYLMVFERFLFRVLTTLPNGITSDLYLLYGIQVVGVALVFVVGILLLPSLTASLFSGHTGQGIVERLIRR
jgi:type IV secretory pathway VirB6-like protein